MTRLAGLSQWMTTVSTHLPHLTISVVIRGCAIPVAWHLVEATRPGAWRPHWEALFTSLSGAVPSDWMVIVLADRGLYAKWLFTAIQSLGWHPFLRLNRQGRYCHTTNRRSVRSARLWVVSVGSHAEATLPVPMLDDLPITHIARRRATGTRPPGAMSCFRRGRLVIIAALVHGQSLPLGRLIPEPWPKSLDTRIERSSAYRPLSKAA